MKPEYHKSENGCYVFVQGHKIKCHTIELAYEYAKKYIDRLILAQEVAAHEL